MDFEHLVITHQSLKRMPRVLVDMIIDYCSGGEEIIIQRHINNENIIRNEIIYNLAFDHIIQIYEIFDFEILSLYSNFDFIDGSIFINLRISKIAGFDFDLNLHNQFYLWEFFESDEFEC